MEHSGQTSEKCQEEFQTQSKIFFALLVVKRKYQQHLQWLIVSAVTLLGKCLGYLQLNQEVLCASSFTSFSNVSKTAEGIDLRV